MGLAVMLRHGRSTANVEGALAGRTPGISLHESGRAHARELAPVFAATPVASLHVSPLERTRETATLALPGRPQTIAEAITEVDCGRFAGLPFTEIASHADWIAHCTDPASYAFPEGESIATVADRVIPYVTTEARGDGMHVFVTHADVILLMANHAAGAPLREFQRLHVDPCSITIISVEDAALRVLALNVPPSGAYALLTEATR